MITSKSNSKYAIVFWCVSLLHLLATGINIPALPLITKPLIIPALLLWVSVSAAIPRKKWILLIALCFSWIGDIALMLEQQEPFLFIIGLACFLLTHVLYIFYFLKIRSQAVSGLKRNPVLLAVVFGYGVALVYFLLPKLGALALPVILYAITICTMLTCSLHVYYKVNKAAAVYYVAGALFFVTSDSLLAINKFYQPFPFAGIAIMLTYCAAQFCIVKGFLADRINYSPAAPAA